jgi:uncharacterized protein (TIGR02145 family)
LTFDASVIAKTTGKDNSDAFEVIHYALFKVGTELYKDSIVIHVKDCDCCGSGVTDVEGNTYTAYRFGTAGCWMTENLATKKNQKKGATLTKGNSTTYDPRYDLPSTSNNSTTLTETQAQNSNYYGNNEGKPGFFYNWAAAVGAETSAAARNTTSYPACSDCNPPVNTVNVASQDICPTGWHLPSDWEWNNLEKEITDSYTQYSTASADPTTWNDTWRTTFGSYRGGHSTLMRNPKNIGSTQSPAGLSNAKEKGFSGLLVGCTGNSDARWANYGNTTGYWSSSSGTTTAAWERFVWYNEEGVRRANGGKYFMWSVRCKKNE